MNFIENTANFVLGHATHTDLPDFALLAMQEGLESESLNILAGLSKENNSFEIDKYFKKALDELNIKLPDEKQAVLILLHYYLKTISNKQMDPVEGMEKIVRQVLWSIDSERLFGKNKKFAWDCINMHTLYGLYWEYDDLQGSTHQWNNEKTNEELMEGIKNQIIEEATNYLKQNETKKTK